MLDYDDPKYFGGQVKIGRNRELFICHRLPKINQQQQPELARHGDNERNRWKTGRNIAMDKKTKN